MVFRRTLNSQQVKPSKWIGYSSVCVHVLSGIEPTIVHNSLWGLGLWNFAPHPGRDMNLWPPLHARLCGCASASSLWRIGNSCAQTCFWEEYFHTAVQDTRWDGGKDVWGRRGMAIGVVCTSHIKPHWGFRQVNEGQTVPEKGSKVMRKNNQTANKDINVHTAVFC